MNFGTNVKKYRRKAKLTQVELAQATGVTPSMINQIEKGIKNPSVLVGFEIAKALKTTLDELCKGA
ncbi:helix-turn-helix domain-containing protein [Ruminococcus sp.]|jgi:putative transcriptional regulator|uniref:helix-turn-helix domain-containing protein n=1 Tax=Ruminococcus sp. TaxID=41978 RepID=UPI0020518162|nr:MAG TPA: helix-turn-helix domain protein [Caudoviricetes sp.]